MIKAGPAAGYFGMLYTQRPLHRLIRNGLVLVLHLLTKGTFDCFSKMQSSFENMFQNTYFLWVFMCPICAT